MTRGRGNREASRSRLCRCAVRLFLGIILVIVVARMLFPRARDPWDLEWACISIGFAGPMGALVGVERAWTDLKALNR